MSLPFKRYFSNYSLNDGGMMGKIKQTLKIADSRFTCKVAVEFFTTYENKIITLRFPPSHPFVIVTLQKYQSRVNDLFIKETKKENVNAQLKEGLQAKSNMIFNWHMIRTAIFTQKEILQQRIS